MHPRIRKVLRAVDPHHQTVRKHSKRIFKRLGDYAGIHQALILLTLFILFNNILSVKASETVAFSEPADFISDPYQIADTVRLLSDFTPNIDENPDTIATALEAKVNGNFISTNPLIATQEGISDEGETNTPSATPTPGTQRTIETKYTVQIGDTISGIGSKFGLKVSSIQLSNNLSDVDTIKPGQVLLIPTQDASEKALKAAEDRKKASQALAQSATTAKKASLSAGPAGGYGFILPLQSKGISRRLEGGHTGIDYRADVGTPVYAAADGVAVIATEAGWNGGYGKTILLNVGSNMTLRYGHLSDVRIAPGQHVAQGQLIALSGNTGRSTGPHLHFELRVNGVAKDPFPQQLH